MDGSDGLGAEGWVEREDGGEVSSFLEGWWIQ